MQNFSASAATDPLRINGEDSEEKFSAVSWPAIWGGVVASVAVAFILIGLGSGLGFAVTSPLAHEGVTAGHFTLMAAVWLIVVQWVSSGLGGYLTGRLRTKWTGVHSHEVFFRDTAHGFLTWCLGTIIGGVFLMMLASSVGKHEAAMAAAGAREGALSSYTDSLLRADHSGATLDPDTRREADYLVMKGVKEGFLSESDKNYLAQIVADRSGMSPSDAEVKIDKTIAQIRQTMEAARKAAATMSIFTFLSMLIGAFIACVAAAIGGQERDQPHLYVYGKSAAK